MSAAVAAVDQGGPFRYFSPASRSGLLSLADVDEIVTVLRRGGLAVLPTETGYALAADATSLDAVRKAFAVKERSHANPMHVACSSLTMARRYGVLDPVAAAVVGACTPGPLTVVVPQTDRLPDSLVTLRGTVGIRVPDCACTLQVIAALDRPLTATSLNRSGEEHAPVTAEGLAELAWPDGETVCVVLDDAALVLDKPSTLVSLDGGRPTVLRAGPIDESEIARLAAAAAARTSTAAPTAARTSTAAPTAARTSTVAPAAARTSGADADAPTLAGDQSAGGERS